MNFKTVPFQISHLDLIEMRDQESGVANTLPDFKERMKFARSDESLVFMYDGRIIAIMGYTRPWDGVIDGWTVPSKYVELAPILFAKTVRRYVEAVAETFKCHRFQTGSFADPFHDRWMQFLGFEKEGVMKQYTPDKRDYVNYARFFTWQS